VRFAAFAGLQKAQQPANWLSADLCADAAVQRSRSPAAAIIPRRAVFRLDTIRSRHDLPNPDLMFLNFVLVRVAPRRSVRAICFAITPTLAELLC